MKRLLSGVICIVLFLSISLQAEFTPNLSGKYDNLGPHPGYDMISLRPDGWEPSVGGVDTLSGNRLVVATAKEMWPGSCVFANGLFILHNVDENDKDAVIIDTIALTMEAFNEPEAGFTCDGLATQDIRAAQFTEEYEKFADVHPMDDPNGILVINDTIYVMEIDKLSRFIDINGDGTYAKKELVFDVPFGGGYWEFAFGGLYHEGKWFYSKATSVHHGGKRDIQMVPHNGCVNAINPDGTIEEIGCGLRTPSGIGFGVDGELFVTDNQGIWNPPNDMHHVKKGRFWGHNMLAESIQSIYANEPTSPTTVMFPHGDISKSLGNTVPIDVGMYKGQMLVADQAHAAIKRVFLEKIQGEYQGVAFPFSGGLEAGSYRLKMMPNGDIYVGDQGACCSMP